MRAEQGDKDDEVFYHVVAERALELRDDERPEAALRLRIAPVFAELRRGNDCGLRIGIAHGGQANGLRMGM